MSAIVSKAGLDTLCRGLEADLLFHHLKGVKISSVMSHAHGRDAIRRECFAQGFCCWCSEAGALWNRAARVGQAIDAGAND